LDILSSLTPRLAGNQGNDS